MLKYSTIAVLSGLLSTTLLNLPSQAQMTPDLTLPNNTSVTLEGSTTTINGGTRIGNNLFHSFKDFSVPTGITVQFANLIGIENIITRVTGGSLSNIDGLIKVNGTGNLFLINPNGIIFGPNARLDMGGSFFASTADAVRFTDGEFSAINPQNPPLLIINVPTGLKFGRNSSDIEVNGTGKGLTALSSGTSAITRNSEETGLKVQSGETLALLGGNITLKGGTLTAEQGQIELGSVDSGIVSFTPNSQGWTFGYEGVSSFKNINLSQQSLVDTSGTRGGSIALQGKVISVDEGSGILIQNHDLPSGDITLKASDLLKISDVSPTNGRIYSIVRTESLGTEVGGSVNIFTRQLVLEGGGNLGTRSYGIGKGGNTNVDASDSVQLLGFSSYSPFFTSSIVNGTVGSGDGGDITLTTGYLLAQDGGLITAVTRSTGMGGNVSLTANSIELVNSTALINSGQDFVNYIPSYIAAQTFNEGNAGRVTINTLKLNVGTKATVNTSSTGTGSAGSLLINADDLEISGTVSSAVVVANTNTQQLGSPSEPNGDSGNVVINTKKMNVTGGLVSVRNLGTSNAGTLSITANSIKLSDNGAIAASSASGEGGNIFLGAQNLQLRQASTVTASAGNSGNGGNITIKGGTVAVLEGSSITANAYEGRGGNIIIDARGVFISPDGTVSATSEKGIDGLVEINRSQNDLSSVLSTPTAIDTPEVTVCAAQQSDGVSELVSTGRGGLAQTPSDPLNSILGWEDNRNPTSKQSQENQQSAEIEPPQKIVEAQGWNTNPDGTVSFTNRPSQATPYNSATNSPCLNQTKIEDVSQQPQEIQEITEVKKAEE